MLIPLAPPLPLNKLCSSSQNRRFSQAPEDSSHINTLKTQCRAFLVAQWLKICLLMQGTRVRALVWEDPTCCGATRPVSHNY